MRSPYSFYEFFAGGGMARAGLGNAWRCLLANDFSEMKAETYCRNWGPEDFVSGDIAALSAAQLPGQADLAWASFPCQDLSLAGRYRGLGDASDVTTTRSGTFWSFWSLMEQLKRQKRQPRIIVLENVPGLLTSNGGADFIAVCQTLATSGYRYGPVIVDANWFVPQSRSRIFFIAVAADVPLPGTLVREEHDPNWHSVALTMAQGRLTGHAADRWVWWNMPIPNYRNVSLTDVIEDQPTGCKWHSLLETDRLLAMMTPLQRAKVARAQASGTRVVGSVYKRTRIDTDGVKRQRAEVRFDDKAGCLRTPAGGSSRQTIMLVDGQIIRSRLLSPREAARLMGLNDDYILPTRYNDAYHVAGDGVCVPVVRHIADQLLEPIIEHYRFEQGGVAA